MNAAIGMDKRCAGVRNHQSLSDPVNAAIVTDSF